MPGLEPLILQSCSNYIITNPIPYASYSCSILYASYSCLITCPAGTQGRQRYNSTHSPPPIGGGGGSASRPGSFPSGKDPVKVKFALKEAMKSQKGSGGVALLILILGTFAMVIALIWLPYKLVCVYILLLRLLGLYIMVIIWWLWY